MCRRSIGASQILFGYRLIYPWIDRNSISIFFLVCQKRQIFMPNLKLIVFFSDLINVEVTQSIWHWISQYGEPAKIQREDRAPEAKGSRRKRQLWTDPARSPRCHTSPGPRTANADARWSAARNGPDEDESAVEPSPGTKWDGHGSEKCTLVFHAEYSLRCAECSNATNAI